MANTAICDHLVTNWWPLGDNLVTTWWPFVDYLVIMWWPLTLNYLFCGGWYLSHLLSFKKLVKMSLKWIIIFKASVSSFMSTKQGFQRVSESDRSSWICPCHGYGTTKNMLDVLPVRELENIAQSAFVTFVFFPNSTESRCAFELQPIFGQFSQFRDSVSDQVWGSTSDLEIFSVLWK